RLTRGYRHAGAQERLLTFRSIHGVEGSNVGHEALRPNRLAARVAQQPGQPEDGDLLHQPPAAVRTVEGGSLRHTARTRPDLLLSDTRVALVLRRRGREDRRPTATFGGSTHARRHHGWRADRARATPGER